MRLSGDVHLVRFVWLPVLLVALVLSGCAAQSAAQPSATIATSAPALATQVVPTIAAVQETVTAVAPTVAAAATTVATVAPAATSATTMTVTTTATVMMSKNAKLGDILTDDKGMTLYLYTKDTKNTSNCYDKCAANWPPLLTAGAPQAGSGADAALLGTTTRKDGTMQVTYGGWPVYYWIKDKQPGDATGQDVGGVWFVLDARGEQVKTPAAAATTQPTAASSSGSAPAAGSAPATGKTVKVNIRNFSFGSPLTIPVGTTVVWTNQDDMTHTVTATNGAFDSGDLDKDGQFSFTFTKAGTFNYACNFHPNMKGTITVTQ